MSTSVSAAPASASNPRFQQLLKAKMAAEPAGPLSSPASTTRTPGPVDQAFAHLASADTVFNPTFMGQHYQLPGSELIDADPSNTAPKVTAGQTQEIIWSTPQQHNAATLQPDYRQWRGTQVSSPATSQSVMSTPSVVDSLSSVSSSGLPVTPTLARATLSPNLNPDLSFASTESLARTGINSISASVPAPAGLQPYGLGAFTNMNGQVTIPGVTKAASHQDDGSLNLNGLTGDGAHGYDQGAFGADGTGGFGGDHFGDNGTGGYGPPGGDEGGGPPEGDDPGDGGPPPPPPRGKKLALACHFCRRRKLKCDGIKPICDNCAKRGETCTYDNAVRRRGPGKRTKEMRQRIAAEHPTEDPDTSFSSFTLDDPSQQIAGPSHQPLQPIAPALDPSQQSQHQATASAFTADESSIPSANLPDIDPNIDPALAILGMGIEPNPHDHDAVGGVAPATLAEADPNASARGQKRKSDLATGDRDKRTKLEDETYEAALPDHTNLDVGIGVGMSAGVPDFSAWGTGVGRDGEVDEEDLAKFENDLRRVIQDQAEAEAKALDQGQGQQ